MTINNDHSKVTLFKQPSTLVRIVLVNQIQVCQPIESDEIGLIKLRATWLDLLWKSWSGEIWLLPKSIVSPCNLYDSVASLIFRKWLVFKGKPLPVLVADLDYRTLTGSVGESRDFFYIVRWPPSSTAGSWQRFFSSCPFDFHAKHFLNSSFPFIRFRYGYQSRTREKKIGNGSHRHSCCISCLVYFSVLEIFWTRPRPSWPGVRFLPKPDTPHSKHCRRPYFVTQCPQPVKENEEGGRRQWWCIWWKRPAGTIFGLPVTRITIVEEEE